MPKLYQEVEILIDSAVYRAPLKLTPDSCQKMAVEPVAPACRMR